MTRKMIGVLAGLALAALGSTSVAQDVDELEAGPFAGAPHGGFGRGRGGPGGPGVGQLMRTARALDLSEEQRTAVRELIAKNRETVKPLLEQARPLHEKIRQQLEAGNPDATALGQLMIEQHRLMAQVRATHKDVLAAFEGLLDAKQKAKFELLREMHGRDGEDGPGRRGGRPGFRGRGPRPPQA